MQRKMGVVLGGGGARGFFHMGVIKAIQELGIEIGEISGTSIGAVIGTMYAADPKINFEKLALEMDFLKLVQAIVLGTNLQFNKSLEKFIGDYIAAKNFAELKIPMRFNATDVNNNQEIVFETGEILPGLLASIAIPGVFPPQKFEEKFLVDGGMTNNIPIPLIKNMKEVIVSDISGPIKKIDDKTMPIDVLYSSFATMQRNYSLEKAKDLKKKIIYLELKDETTFILDFRKSNYANLINLGYEAMMEKAKDI